MPQTRRALRKEIAQLKELVYEYEDYGRVLTGHTYSYNALRELFLELLDKLPENEREQYSEKLKHIDAIAHHYTIAKDK